MVRSASLAIAIRAPVFPPDKAALAWPSFTALIAIPIDVVLARRIAWLGFSDAAIASVVWWMVTASIRGRCFSSSGPISWALLASVQTLSLELPCPCRPRIAGTGPLRSFGMRMTPGTTISTPLWNSKRSRV